MEMKAIGSDTICNSDGRKEDEESEKEECFLIMHRRGFLKQLNAPCSSFSIIP